MVFHYLSHSLKSNISAFDSIKSFLLLNTSIVVGSQTVKFIYTRKAVNGHNLGSSKMNECSLLSITTYLFIYICLHGSGRVSRGAKNRLKMCPGGVISHRAEYRDPGHIWWQQTPVCGYTSTNVAVDMSAVGALWKNQINLAGFLWLWDWSFRKIRHERVENCSIYLINQTEICFNFINGNPSVTSFCKMWKTRQNSMRLLQGVHCQEI